MVVEFSLILNVNLRKIEFREVFVDNSKIVVFEMIWSMSIWNFTRKQL